MNKVKTNTKEYVRDMDSKALLNTDKESLLLHRKKNKIIKSQMENTKNIYSEIDNMKSEINDIKNLLLQLIGKEQ